MRARPERGTHLVVNGRSAERFLLLLAGGASFLGAVLFSCSSSEADGPDRVNQDAGSGAPTHCAVYSGATNSDACSCGETTAPFSGAPTDKCPINDLPHYCVEYD